MRRFYNPRKSKMNGKSWRKEKDYRDVFHYYRRKSRNVPFTDRSWNPNLRAKAIAMGDLDDTEGNQSVMNFLSKSGKVRTSYLHARRNGNFESVLLNDSLGLSGCDFMRKFSKLPWHYKRTIISFYLPSVVHCFVNGMPHSSYRFCNGTYPIYGYYMHGGKIYHSVKEETKTKYRIDQPYADSVRLKSGSMVRTLQMKFQSKGEGTIHRNYHFISNEYGSDTAINQAKTLPTLKMMSGYVGEVRDIRRIHNDNDPSGVIVVSVFFHKTLNKKETKAKSQELDALNIVLKESDYYI